MKTLQRHIAYARRHLDFIIIDILTFALSYYATVQMRRIYNKPIWHEELFVKYGVVATFLFIVVDIVSHNLNGITYRGFSREIQKIGELMGMTWSFYTVVLFMLKEAHFFSRSIYLITFVLCCFLLLITRSVWKYVSRYSTFSNCIQPRLLIVCEGFNAQKVLYRLLHGSYENQYEITGLLVTARGFDSYNDCYPCVCGLEKLQDCLTDRRIQEVYIELDDVEEEGRIIHLLLEAGITVHRSLGDSRLRYNEQYLDEISDKSVITITDSRISLIGRLDDLLRTLWER